MEYLFSQTGQSILPSGDRDEEEELDESSLEVPAEDADEGFEDCSSDPTIVPLEVSVEAAVTEQPVRVHAISIDHRSSSEFHVFAQRSVLSRTTCKGLLLSAPLLENCYSSERSPAYPMNKPARSSDFGTVCPRTTSKCVSFYVDICGYLSVYFCKGNPPDFSCEPATARTSVGSDEARERMHIPS